jgi:hypothetical protein
VVGYPEGGGPDIEIKELSAKFDLLGAVIDIKRITIV